MGTIPFFLLPFVVVALISLSVAAGILAAILLLKIIFFFKN